MALPSTFNKESSRGIQRMEFAAAAAIPTADGEDLVSRVDHVAKQLQEDAFNKGVQVLADSTGLDASVVLGGLIGRSGVDATIEAALRDEEESKKNADEAMFLMLLDDYASLANQLNDTEQYMAALEEAMADLESGDANVEELMEREAVQEAIRDWEARTGRAFDPEDGNAEVILMQIMQEGHEQAAIDAAILREQMEGIREQIPNIDALVEVDPETGLVHARELISESANSAFAFAEVSENVALVSEARAGRDDHSEDALSEAGAGMDDLFAGMLAEAQPAESGDAEPIAPVVNTVNPFDFG